MKTVKKKWAGWLVALLFTFIITAHLEAATLSVGSATGAPGDTNISIPVVLGSTPGEKVSSFNFDLNFDASRLSFKEVTLGSGAANAGKSLSFNKLKSSAIRVIVIGFNQDAIADGTVLTFTFDILDKAPDGKAELNITKPAISDPKGKLLAVTTKGGEVRIVK